MRCLSFTNAVILGCWVLNSDVMLTNLTRRGAVPSDTCAYVHIRPSVQDEFHLRASRYHYERQRSCIVLSSAGETQYLLVEHDTTDCLHFRNLRSNRRHSILSRVRKRILLTHGMHRQQMIRRSTWVYSSVENPRSTGTARNHAIL